MNEEKYHELEAEVSEKFDSIISELSKRFQREIADLDSEPERDRICLLEDMIREARIASDAAYLDFMSNLINSIDEGELIERKKENIKRRG